MNKNDKVRIVGTDVTGTIGDNIVEEGTGHVTLYTTDGGRRVVHIDNLEKEDQ